MNNEQGTMNNTEDIQVVMAEIYRAIFKALEGTLHRIGSVIDGEARKAIIDQKIRDKDDFLNNAGYLVQTNENGMTLRVGSNVAHEPFVLGGKVPSWTPIAPLIAWVERHNLGWLDKKTGDALTVEQMAYMIRGAIKTRGIAARNVYQEVINNREAWIYAQFASIDIKV